MGRAKKEHNRKIAKRNEKIKVEQKKIQKIYTEMLESKMKEFQEKFSKMSGQTETLTEDNTMVTLNGQPLNFSVIDPSELELPTEQNQ